MHLHNCRLRLSSPFMNHRASETRKRKPPALINKAGTFYSSANESSRSALLQFLERGKSMTNHLPTHAKKSCHGCSYLGKKKRKKRKTSLHLPPLLPSSATWWKAVLVAREKPWRCNLARQLGFQLQNRAHPSCQPPIDGVFNQCWNSSRLSKRSASFTDEEAEGTKVKSACSELPWEKKTRKKLRVGNND